MLNKKIIEQIALIEELQSVAGINVVNCGSCGSVLLHRIVPMTEDCNITCPYCDFNSEPCNFPDFLYRGTENLV